PGIAETSGRGRSHQQATYGFAAALSTESCGNSLGEKFHDDFPRSHRLAGAVSKERSNLTALTSSVIVGPHFAAALSSLGACAGENLRHIKSVPEWIAENSIITPPVR